MDVSHPISAVVPSAHGPVLTVLARAGTPLTGRGIAALTTPVVSQRQVSQILTTLTLLGLVRVTDAGSANLYELNRDHIAADAVEILATLRDRLWERMRAAADAFTHRPDALVVYGSTARADGDETSDIDILIVRPDGVPDTDPAWQADLTDFAIRVGAWTGNAVELLDRSHSELAVMGMSGERLLHNIRQDGRFLIGTRSIVPEPMKV